MDGVLNWLRTVTFSDIAGVVALVISGLALWEARRSGHASQRSAVASEQSSTAAIEANAFQRQVWRAERSADVVFDLSRSSIQRPNGFDGYLFEATFRNEGTIAARDVGLGLRFEGHPDSWLLNVDDLAAGEERTFRTDFTFEEAGESAQKDLTLRLTYRDRVGRHRVAIPVSFEMGTGEYWLHAATGPVTHTVEPLDLALRSDRERRHDYAHPLADANDTSALPG